jgi:hypothetical protein
MVYGSGYRAPDHGKKASWLRYVPTAAFRTPGSVGKTVSSVWFTTNGAPTHVSPQGEILTWAANCLTNDTLQWEIWIDTNHNGLFDSTGANQDQYFGGYSVANGDTIGHQGLPDTTAVSDNEIVNAIKNGFAPALYWFKAVSLVDGSSAFDSVRVTPMVSPWATVSGHVHVPGDSALQAGLWVEADLEGQHEVFWAAITDQYGNYTINFDNAYQNENWGVGGLQDLAGASDFYVAPPNTQIMVTAGDHSGVDFYYQIATDSITGDVTQYGGGGLPFEPYVWCQGPGGRDKSTTTQGGHYQFFFAAADSGAWQLGLWWDRSDYMQPNSRQNLYPVGAGELVENFVIYPADELVTGAITENGGAPTNQYRVMAWSNDYQMYNSVISQAGTGYYSLPVSGVESQYSVSLTDWDEDYPIPAGWVVQPSGYYPVNPPASGLDFNLSQATEFIEGQITQDAGDAQAINFNNTNVQAWPLSGGSGINAQPDGAGYYSIPVTVDTYNVGAWSNGFLFKPSQHQNVAVNANDTIQGKDFIANYAHCRVEVTLVGYPAATQNWMSASDNSAGPNGYQANVEVNNSGTYNLYICNSTGWNVWAPNVIGYNVSPGSYSIGDITHSDTYRGVYTFTYVTGVEGNPQDRPMPAVFKLSQNHPNPVRNAASISYQLPKPAKVSMTIYNILGQAVKSFDEGSKDAGYYNIKWDGRDDRNNQLGNGIYLYRLQAGDYSATKKMILVR